MMVSKYKMAEYIKDHMEEITWREGQSGGFVGQLHSVMIHISGSNLVRVVMTISDGAESYTITDVPSGPKPLNIAEKFRVHILRREPKPIEAEEQAYTQLKETLGNIVTYAAKQCLKKYEDPQWDRKLRGRLWDKMTGGY
jgi:hypothetical protein